jgi:hypothetical protein
MITRDKTIMYFARASLESQAVNVCEVMLAKSALLRCHRSPRLLWVSMVQIWLWELVRVMLTKVHPDLLQRGRLGQVWHELRWWLAGFREIQIR